MKSISAKHIVYPMKNGDSWFGGDYNMNLYKGCCHGCIYCDSRSNCYQIDNFDTVRMKEHALEIVLQDIKGKRKKGIVGIGAMSDTYNPFERQLELTRGTLEILLRYGFGVAIDTKSDLIVRDKDLISEISKASGAIVKFSITCADDSLSRRIEPRVCVSSKRFAAMKELADAGIYTGVLIHPTLPFITDNEENIKTLVRMSYEHGAKFIYTMFGVTLRENQRDYYYAQLDKEFPGLSAKYRRRYGDKYMCACPEWKKLKEVFIQECKRYGLHYRMADIIRSYKKQKDEQLTLF